MAYRTDGFVPEYFVKRYPRGNALAKRLVAAGLWRRGESDGVHGWWFHDWKPECTKARIDEAREKARLRKQRSRESHRDDPPTSPSVSPPPSRVTSPVTDASRHADVWDQPNPTHPNPLLVVDKGGVVTQVTREEPPPCRRHPAGTDEPCVACQRRRVWAQARDAERHADELSHRRRVRELVERCPDCRGTNVIDVNEDQVRKCTHPSVSELAHA